MLTFLIVAVLGLVVWAMWPAFKAKALKAWAWVKSFRADTKGSTSPQASGGIGIFGLLTVAFVVLKLTGYIAWSWWWVLSPLWLPSLILLAIALAVFTLAVFFDRT